MKMGAWLVTMPALLVSGMPAAHAGIIEDLICWLTGKCGPGGGGGGGGPVSVSEPEMLALFSTGLIVAGIAAMRRKRRK